MKNKNAIKSMVQNATPYDGFLTYKRTMYAEQGMMVLEIKGPSNSFATSGPVKITGTGEGDPEWIKQVRQLERDLVDEIWEYLSPMMDRPKIREKFRWAICGDLPGKMS